MKAAIYHRYGPPEVVTIGEAPTPRVGPTDILVRVHATTVSAADWRLRKADPFVVRLFNGLLRPVRHSILGMEFSGVVEAVGPQVSRFHPGDEVFGSPLFKLGAHAEYVCVPQDGPVALKPAALGFEEAAAVMFGALTAFGFYRRADIRPGQRVLVYGASGSVGVFAVQLAKASGAHVTGVCSARNQQIVRAIGADEVIDYASQDFAAAGPSYDLIFETVGKSSFRRGLKALKPGGLYLTCAPMPLPMIPFLCGLLARRAGARGVATTPGKGSTGAAAVEIARLIEAGQMRTVIDRIFPFDEIAQAHRLAESGHKRGHAVVKIR